MDNKNNLFPNQLAAEYPHSISDIYISIDDLIDLIRNIDIKLDGRREWMGEQVDFISIDNK